MTIRVHHELRRPSKTRMVWMTPMISTPKSVPEMRPIQPLLPQGKTSQPIPAAKRWVATRVAGSPDPN